MVTSPTGGPRTKFWGTLRQEDCLIAICGYRFRFALRLLPWGMGIITVQMLNLGFPFTQAELFTLTTIAGISGATMRIPASFLDPSVGRPQHDCADHRHAAAPAIGTGIALQHPEGRCGCFG